MSKKKRRKSRKERRARPKHSPKLILSIIMTDSTFSFHPERNLPPGWGIWVGKCIHCGRKLGVTERGTTGATIEHVLPLCAGGDPTDPKNLALACSGCNNEKGVRHDQHVGKGGRADEVITALQGKRLARWRDPVVQVS